MQLALSGVPGLEPKRDISSTRRTFSGRDKHYEDYIRGPTVITMPGVAGTWSGPGAREET